MNPTEFKTAREARMTLFDEQYSALKAQYSTALTNAIKEQDRTKQCVLIKSALDTNQKLSELVQQFLIGTDDSNCKITPDRIRALREDIEKYKSQYAEIQQGKDRIYSLQAANNDLEQKIEILHGIETIYIVLIALGLVLLVILIVYSGVRNAFDTKSIVPVVPGGLAKPSYF